jgi:hypothetical protein
VQILQFKHQQRDWFVFWLPALVAGASAWILFMTIGGTPVLRASGMALAVVGLSLTLRRFGAFLSIVGGLALALSPAFWSQTGGTERLNLPVTMIAVVAAMVIALLFARFGQRMVWGAAAGLIVFSILFWSQLARIGSLRLTTLLTAWTLYLIIDTLLITNPRPEEPSPAKIGLRHKLGFLLLLTIGVVNDPLFVLLAPAVLLCLIISRSSLPWWYWGLLLVVVAIGAYGVAVNYLDSGWWLFPAAQAEANGIRVPFVISDGWREASRWLYLFNLVIGQFSVVGIVLGIIGLSRMSRWYPPIGSVTMIAYAAYALFGLVYFGKDSDVLLLPLLMIQVIWMTYAVYTLGEWLQKSFKSSEQAVRWVAPAVFSLMPLLMLLRIAGLV